MSAVRKAKPKVVILGGGNGTSRLLVSLVRELTAGKLASLHALVQMADDGGSTGRLRAQYNVAAVGDLTKCLLALSSFKGDVRGDEFLKALEYRFERGDFEGHTLRNIFLTALEVSQRTAQASARVSTIDAAIATMARILQIPKAAGVVPTTTKPLTEQVVISFNGEDNLLGEGEHSIAHRVNLQADPRWQPGEVKVRFKEGDVKLATRAQMLLAKATHIVVAPGHTYGTILPTLALPALMRAVRANREAKLVVVMTLLTTPHQTSGWSGEDFVQVYESYLGRKVDTVVANTGTPKVGLVAGQEWVRFKEKSHDYELRAANLVSRQKQGQSAADVVPRAVVVHDDEQLNRILADMFLK